MNIEYFEYEIKRCYKLLLKEGHIKYSYVPNKYWSRNHARSTRIASAAY